MLPGSGAASILDRQRYSLRRCGRRHHGVPEPRRMVLAITTVVGNLPVAQSTRNALYLAEFCGARCSVGVSRHASSPRLRMLAVSMRLALRLSLEHLQTGA